MPRIKNCVPNIHFLKLLKGAYGFRRAYDYAQDPFVIRFIRRRGFYNPEHDLHYNALYLVFMKRACDQGEQDMKEALIFFLLRNGVSLLSSGVDQYGESCLKHIDDLSPKTYATVRNCYLHEYRKVFPEDFNAQRDAAKRRKEEAVAAADILRVLKSATV